MHTLTPADKALVINGGSFGQRFVQLLELHEIPHTEIRMRKGSALKAEMLAPYEGQGYTAFLVNIDETSTGVLYDIDLIGDKKPQGRYRDVLWDMSPLEILVHEPMPEGMVETMGLWGWPREEARWYWPGHEGERLQVRVFTKAPQVRLEVNGEIIGVQKTNREYIALFEGVEYRPGKLVAVSLDAAGKELESRVLLTPGKPASVRLLRERYNIDNELVYLKAEVIDDQGVVVPEAFPLTFDIQGASFVSSGNGGEMLGGFLQNLSHGNVSGMGMMGLVLSAFLIFGRFGWMAKLAGAMLAMMTIGNNSQRVLSSATAASQAEAQRTASADMETPQPQEAEQIHRRR